MSVDSGLCTVARLLTGIQERANHSFALGMYVFNSNSLAKSVVSNFWRSPRVTSPRNFTRARVSISPAPQSRSPKLETTRSLGKCCFQTLICLLTIVVKLSVGDQIP